MTPRVRRITRRVGAGLLGVVGGLLVLLAIGVLVITTSGAGHSLVRRLALRAARGSVHGIVSIGSIDGDLLDEITINDLSIRDSSGAPFLSVRRMSARYHLADLVRKRLYLDHVDVEGPTIELVQSQDSVWNFKRIFPTSGAASTQPGFGSWITLTDLRISGADLTTRSPWHPDSTLRGAARDSAIRFALGPDSRLMVHAVSDGYEKTVAIHELSASLPLVRLADPAHPIKVFQSASLSADIAAFRPPDAIIRNVVGTFFFTADSLWWTRAAIALPNSHITGHGMYGLTGTAMALGLRADPAALADLRFLDPRLPDTGGLKANLAVRWLGRTQDYTVTQLAFSTGPARVSGQVGITMGDSMALHDTDLSFSGIDTRLIERLSPTLRLGREGSLDGHASLSGGLHALTLNLDLGYDDSAAGPNRITAVGEVGVGDGFQAKHLRITLEPLQVALAQAKMPSLPIGGTVTGEATLNGTTAGIMSATADLMHQQGPAITHLVAGGDVAFAPSSPTTPERARAVPVERGRTGLGASTGTTNAGALSRFRPDRVSMVARFQPVDLSTLGRFMPAAKLHGRAVGTLRVSGDMRDMAIASHFGIIGAPDSSGLALTGHVHLNTPEPGYDLRLDARLFDAHAVSAAAPPTSVTASAHVAGHGVHPDSMTATVAADVNASALDSVRVDTVHLRATVGNGQLHLDTARIRALATTITAGGTLGLVPSHPGTLTYDVAIDSLNAYNRFVPHDTTNVAARPGAVASALAQARADSARHAQATEVERAMTGAPPPLLSVDTSLAIRADSLAGRVHTSGTVHGDIHAFDLSGEMTADSVYAMGNAARRARVSYHVSGGPHSTAPMAATIQVDSARLRGFTLDSLDGRVTFHRPDGTLRLVVLQDPLRTYIINSKFHYAPDLKELSYDTLSFRFDTTTWRAVRPGSIQFGASGLLVHQIDLANGPRGRIQIDGELATKQDTEAHLHASIRQLDLADVAAMAEEAAPMQGQIALEADLVGSTNDPRLQGHMSLASASVRDVPLPNIYIGYQYDTAALTLHGELAPKGAPAAPFTVADMTVPINLAANATGSRLLDRPLSGEVRLDSLPLDVVPQFMPSVRGVGGLVRGHITLGGTPQQPAPTGTLTLDNGSAIFVPTGTAFGGMLARLRITRDSVVVDSIVATTPSTGGRIQMTGTLDRSDPAVPVLNATMHMNDARLMNTQERGRVDADASLTAGGPLQSLYVYGNTTVRNAIYYIQPITGKHLIDLNSPVVYRIADTTKSKVRKVLPSPSSPFQHLRMDVEVTINRDTWVRNQNGNVEAHTNGPLTVHVDRGQQAIVINGSIGTDRGEYSFLGKRFTITKGTATFVGTPDFNPTVEASGEYDVPVPGQGALAIQILITGSVDSLKLELSSNHEPPLSQSDLLSYLAFGQPTSGVGSSQSSSLTGTSNAGGVVGTASTFVEDQLAAEALSVFLSQAKSNLARALDADVLDITTGNNFTDIAAQHNDAAATFLESTQLEFGKYFTPDTYVALQASVAPGARVIHRLQRGLSMELSGQPLYLLGQPTLSTNQNTPLTGVLGLSLTKSWRF